MISVEFKAKLDSNTKKKNTGAAKKVHSNKFIWSHGVHLSECS